VGLRAVPNAVVKRKIPSPRRESNSRTPIVGKKLLNTFHYIWFSFVLRLKCFHLPFKPSLFSDTHKTTTNIKGDLWRHIALLSLRHSLRPNLAKNTERGSKDNGLDFFSLSQHKWHYSTHSAILGGGDVVFTAATVTSTSSLLVSKESVPVLCVCVCGVISYLCCIVMIRCGHAKVSWCTRIAAGLKGYIIRLYVHRVRNESTSWNAVIP
jgi:hypothetical protein